MTTSAPSRSAANLSADTTGRACDGLIEAAWLAAVIVVPLVFSHYAFVSFEPYKAAMVRLLAAITAAAWAIGIFRNKGFAGANHLPPRSVAIGLAFLLGAQGVATLFSVNPHASLWGIQETSQGLFASVSEAILFLAVAGHLRRAAQLDRLVTALTATSIPVALYAIIQRVGFDPIAFAVSGERVFSNLGHPIYLAAYLMMVMPLTWWKIIQEVEPGSSGGGGQRKMSLVLFHGGVALVQMAGFLSAKSRGPLLGLLATAAFFGLGWAIQTRQWRWLLRGGVILGIVTAFLVFLNLPLVSSTRVANALGLQRFAQTLGFRKGADPFRKAHWEAAVQLMTSPEAIVFPNGGSDRWHLLRPWIGYGPETLQNVLPQRFIWGDTEAKAENRLHDRALDLWFASGAIGLLAFYAFFLLVFQEGLKYAGLGSRRITFVVIPSLALIGSGLFCVVAGKGFLGLGMIVGIVAGCIVSILMSVRTVWKEPPLGTAAMGVGTLMVPLLAALVGHLLETGFAFTVTTTSLLFWLYAAMVLAIAHLNDSAEDAVEIPTPAKSRKGRSRKLQTSESTDWRDACLAAYGPALILVTLLFVFVQSYSFAPVDGTTVLARTLTQIKDDEGPSHLLWFLLIPTWLATNFAFAGDSGKKAAGWFSIVLLISAVIGGAYAILQGSLVAGIGAVPRMTDPPAQALAQLSGYHGIYFTYLGLILALLLMAAWMLDRSIANVVKAAWGMAGANLLAIGLGLVAAWFLALRDIRADITATWGQALVSFGRLEASTAVLQQSVRENPASTVYRRQLAAALIQRAQESPNLETFDWLSREAEASLLAASEQAHGLTTAGADLARFYMAWAGFTPHGDQRIARAQQAAIYFERQQRFLPEHALSWLDHAVLEYFLQHPVEAYSKLQKAVECMHQGAGYWANYCREQSLGCTAPELREAHAEVAFHLFEVAIRESKSPSGTAVLRIQRASLNIGLGRIEEAREECLEAQGSLPYAELWQADSVQAVIDRQSGDLPGAKAKINRAIETAPADKRAMLLDLKRRIDGR